MTFSEESRESSSISIILEIFLCEVLRGLRCQGSRSRRVCPGRPGWRKRESGPGAVNLAVVAVYFSPRGFGVPAARTEGPVPGCEVGDLRLPGRAR